MLKIEYKINSLFSLKKYGYSHLNAMSYEYPMIYTIKCAILGSVIKLEGVEYAQSIFNKIKNSVIYIQYNNQYQKQQLTIKRNTNASYNKMSDEEVLSRKKFTALSTAGVREYINMDSIVFYIDKSIPNLELYLKNIDWIGDGNSLVYLHSIEETNILINVLQKVSDIDENTSMYEQYDWNSQVTFEQLYMFSNKRKHNDNRFLCKITDIKI